MVRTLEEVDAALAAVEITTAGLARDYQQAKANTLGALTYLENRMKTLEIEAEGLWSKEAQIIMTFFKTHGVVMIVTGLLFIGIDFAIRYFVL